MANIDESKYKKISSCVQINEILELIKNIDKINEITDITSEIKDYTEKYLLNVFELLDKNLDKSVTKCPVCGTENVYGLTELKNQYRFFPC